MPDAAVNNSASSPGDEHEENEAQKGCSALDLRRDQLWRVSGAYGGSLSQRLQCVLVVAVRVEDGHDVLAQFRRR